MLQKQRFWVGECALAVDDQDPGVASTTCPEQAAITAIPALNTANTIADNRFRPITMSEGTGEPVLVADGQCRPLGGADDVAHGVTPHQRARGKRSKCVYRRWGGRRRLRRWCGTRCLWRWRCGGRRLWRRCHRRGCLRRCHRRGCSRRNDRAGRLRGGGRARRRQDVIRGESRCLVDHPGLGVLRVRVEVPSARAHEVIWDAQVDGLGRICRADVDLRLVDRSHEPSVWLSEQRDRGDMVATSDGIGFGTPSGAPSGMIFAVTKPITAAPWENPPSTILVLGQFVAVDSTWALASLMPSNAVGKSVVAG